MVRFHWQLQILFMANVSEINTKGLKAASWNFLNMMVNQLRNFIVSLVLARLLTPSDFGLVSMAMVLNSILDFLVDFGFSSAVVRKKTVSIVETSTIFWINIMVGVSCTLLIFCSASVFAWFYEMPALTDIVYITSFSFFISSFGTLQTALFQRDLNFRKPFLAKLISSVTSGVLGIVLALCGLGVWALVLSNLSGWLLYSISIWLMSSWRPRFIFKFSTVSDMITFGWKMTLSTFISRVIRQIDTFVIGKFFSAVSLGLFNRAQSLNQLVVDYSFSSIRGVMLPSLSKLQDDMQAMRYSVLKLINIICFLSFLMSGLMYICASDIIQLLYGTQWIGAIDIFKILGLFSISLSLPVVFDVVMTATNRMTLYLWINIIANIVTLAAIPIGFYYGLMGYIWAVSVSGVVKIIPALFSTQVCIKLPVYKQLEAILRYATPFVGILLLWDMIEFDTGYYIFNIIFNGGLYLIIYILANVVLRNDGLRVCWSLFHQFKKKKFIK